MNSLDYWKRREEEQLKHNITEEKAYEKEIHRIYADMLDGVQKEIDSFYGKYADKEGITLAEAKKRVSQLDIAAYERKAAKYVKQAALDRKANGGKNDPSSTAFSQQANEEMRLYNLTMKVNRLEMLKANIGLETIKGHSELEKFMGKILQGRTMDELERQAGILGKTVKNNAKKAHAIVNGSFHSGTFSDRIWQYQDLMRVELGRLLEVGLIQGKNPRAIAKDLRNYWYGADPKTGGGAEYCMERLMRTELARVQTEAQKQSFIRNGFTQYTFITNGGCCEHCQAINGKHFDVEDMMPGENAPPMHPHCRCSVAAYEDSDEYEAWLDYIANGGTTAEWEKLKTKPKANNAWRSVLLNPKSIAPVNDVTDKKKFDALTYDFKHTGYEGRPVLVVADGEEYAALTGSHRILAARRAEIEIPAHVAKCSEEVAAQILAAKDDDERYEIIKSLYDAKKIDKGTFDLMRAEIDINDEEYGDEKIRVEQKKKADLLKQEIKAAEEKIKQELAAAEEARKKAEEAERKAQEASDEMREYKEYEEMLRKKYGEDKMWLDMTDAEMSKYYKLEARAYGKG